MKNTLVGSAVVPDVAEAVFFQTQSHVKNTSVGSVVVPDVVEAVSFHTLSPSRHMAVVILEETA